MKLTLFLMIMANIFLFNNFLICEAFAQKEPDFKLNKDGKAVPTYLGRIIMLKGSASRLEGGGRRVALKVQSKIKKNQTIATGKGSFLKIKLVDNSIFTMSSSSEIHFKNFNYKSPKERSGVFQLLKGKLRAAIPVKSKKDALKIISGTASMGIRGTKVLVNNRTDKMGNNIVQMALLEGEVVVKNSLTKEEKKLNPGDHLIFVQDIKSEEALNKVEGLEEDVVKELRDIDEEEKKVLPFLPFYNFKGKMMEKGVTFQVNKTRGLKKSLKLRGNASFLELKKKREEERKKREYSWKYVLRRLNKILRENRKSK